MKNFQLPPPRLPKQIIDETLDTSYEFAEANFRGWWSAASSMGFTEIELIDYVTNLRETVRNSKVGAAQHVCV